MRAVVQGRIPMREVKVNRLDLLIKVKENREKHVADYQESVLGYKQAALKAIEDGMRKLKRQVEELQAGEKIRLAAVSFDLAVPENHSKDYDQVISMLEMSVDDHMLIRSDEFAMYVMDDWSWRQSFEGTKAMYTMHK